MNQDYSARRDSGLAHGILELAQLSPRVCEPGLTWCPGATAACCMLLDHGGDMLPFDVKLVLRHGGETLDEDVPLAPLDPEVVDELAELAEHLQRETRIRGDAAEVKVMDDRIVLTVDASDGATWSWVIIAE